MSAENPIPEDYTQQNQKHWRTAIRGIGSRPFELPKIGSFVDARVRKTFSEYGLDQSAKPILTFSIFTDNPKTPSSRFVHEERFPEEIAEEDRQNFSIGISRMNEYAANYATKELFVRNADIFPFKQFTQIYGELADVATYGILLNGTFSRMRNLEIMANHNKINYKHALLTALFQHDTSELDRIIKMGSDYYGYSNVNEMAVEIGKSRFKKPDIGKWFDKLDADRKDGRLKTAAKNGVLSTAALGVYRNPGVIETHGAIIPASPIISAIGTFCLFETEAFATFTTKALEHPEHVGLVLGALPDLIPQPAAAMTATALIISPFVATHESIHHYSADENHLGLIPTQIVEKEITPYKARLETSDK